jgi:hypothetical protein
MLIAIITVAAIVLGGGKGKSDKGYEFYPHIEPVTKEATQILDYYLNADMPWDESYEFTIPEYSGTKFEWTSEKISAVENGEETELFTGMPIWSVFLCDLTGDGLPEICSTVSIGSGIIDNRIIVYDYKNRTIYELSDRFNYDYILSMQSQKLIAVKNPLDSINGGKPNYCSLSIKDGKLILTEIEEFAGDESTATYTSPDYGFSIAFPDSWADKVSIVYQKDEYGERFEIYSPITNVDPAAYIDVHDKSTLRMSGAKEADKLVVFEHNDIIRDCLNVRNDML